MTGTLSHLAAMTVGKATRMLLETRTSSFSRLATRTIQSDQTRLSGDAVAINLWTHERRRYVNRCTAASSSASYAAASFRPEARMTA